MNNRNRPKQTVLPVSAECYMEIIAALVMANAEREVGKAGAQLGRYLFVPMAAEPAAPEPMQPVDDALARHRARVMSQKQSA